MVIGLITEPKRKLYKRILANFFKRFSLSRLCCMENPFEIEVEELLYSKKYLLKMRPEALCQIIEKSAKKLKAKGAEKIIPTKYIKWVCIEKGIKPKGLLLIGRNNMFLKLVPEFIRRTAAKCGMDLMNAAICISCTKQDRISEYLLRELMFDTKYLCLVCDDTFSAVTFAERFYDETGLSLRVGRGMTHMYDIVADVKNASLRVGRDLYVSGAEFGFYFGGYDVDSLDAADCLRRIDADKMTCLYDYGKKKLTL